MDRRLRFPSILILAIVTLATAIAFITLGCVYTTSPEAVETSPGEGPNEPTKTMEMEKGEDGATMEMHEEGDVLEVTLNVVEDRRFSYEPNLMEIPVGQRIKLTLVNGGRAEHDLEVTALPAEHVEVISGEHNGEANQEHQ